MAAEQDNIRDPLVERLIGPGKPFANNGELFAAAASLSLNTDHMAAIVGTAQALDPHFFGA